MTAPEKAPKTDTQPMDEADEATSPVADTAPSGAKEGAETSLDAAQDPALVEFLAGLLMDLHLKTIAQAHPDWQEIAESEDLPAWIATQPPYLARALAEVIENGDADEVIDMLDRFKGTCAQASPAPQNLLMTLDPSAAAVPSRPSGPPRGRPDASDFESAWTAATQKDS